MWPQTQPPIRTQYEITNPNTNIPQIVQTIINFVIQNSDWPKPKRIW